VSSEVFPNVPNGLFSGLRAITSQNYTEANVKNGLQYEAASVVTSLAPGANLDVIFITGNKPVIVKGRNVKFNGLQLSIRVYRAPAYTGGTPISAFNFNDISPIATTVTILGGTTVSDPGVEFGAPTYELGSSGGKDAPAATSSVLGLERILRPNTVYLQRTTNTDATTQLVASSFTWYEGPPDLPLTGPLP
jgi:hypothetical protein